jgi:hypothetical protein
MKKEKKQINILLLGYVVALVISGATAMIVPEGIAWLDKSIPSTWSTIYQWIHFVHLKIQASPKFLLYGFDWLAFAHYVIAMSFYGVWKDPVRNKWVIEWAMLASIAIFPMAFVMGAIRNIPFWWQLIDCSFGVVSLIPLIMIHRRIKVLEIQEQEDSRILKFF